MNAQPAVFLDRDGVLNQAVVKNGRPYPPSSLEQLVLASEAKPAMELLKSHGFLLIGATNQPDVARGTTPQKVVEDINHYLTNALGLDAIYVCYHDDRDHCDCRKPLPGLLKAAAATYNISLDRSFMIGDRWKDIAAGKAAGCCTIFIDLGYDEEFPDHLISDFVTDSLLEGARWICKQAKGKKMEITKNLKVKIFADGADKASMLNMYKKPFIQGLTTNPTLMRKAGITDYEAFAKDILSEIKDAPISFEVFSDDFAEMKKQAYKIASWGDNVYVKIPVTNTKSETCYKLVKELADAGIKQNVTAIFTLDQVQHVVDALAHGPSAYVSVFAGRIADTGCDPVPLMKKAVEILKPYPQLELIWASPRELLNIFQADEIGCHIITVTGDILNKLALVGKDLKEFSLETVKMFYSDANAAGYVL